jgi:hypothetical protein
MEQIKKQSKQIEFQFFFVQKNYFFQFKGIPKKMGTKS